MNLQLGSAIGTATLSDGDVEGTFTMYAVHGLPPSECALLARTDAGWTFIRATDGPLEWCGMHPTACGALVALANAILQTYLNDLVRHQDGQSYSFTSIAIPPTAERRN